MDTRPAPTADVTRHPPRQGDHDDDRLDLGLFGRSVTVLLVALLVAAVAVAVLVDPLVWVLAGVTVGALVLWSRLARWAPPNRSHRSDTER